ncbi:DRBM domain-containing protein [Mycena sanguinolenta]|uniref:DRBM domain-containing protein n=1 Tax=Mycena sanguinolenta TaxID=230812 RepID=A0A8H6U073_9AGAR|nr:DRBM domain-containing protein [Mycena sanguinolenta]
MASFHDVSPENEPFELSFRPTTDAPIYKYRWNRTHCHRKQADSKGTLLNQTTFIHAFAISVCEGIWGRVLGIKVCQPVDSSTFAALVGRSFVPYASQGTSMLWSLFFGSGGHSGGKQCTGGATPPSNGLVTYAFLVPKIIHPSQIIHERILREAPQARVVITHDDDWRDVFKEDGLRTYSELQQAIFDRSEVMQEDGFVFLKPKSSPIHLAAATTQENRDGIITDDSSDNLSISHHAVSTKLQADEPTSGGADSPKSDKGNAPDFCMATSATSASDSSSSATLSALSSGGVIGTSAILLSLGNSYYRSYTGGGGGGGGGGDVYRNRLNNAAQAYRWTVLYETSCAGPQWTAIAYVNNMEYGRGNAGSKGSAKEIAAKEALIALGILRA